MLRTWLLATLQFSSIVCCMAQVESPAIFPKPVEVENHGFGQLIVPFTCAGRGGRFLRYELLASYSSSLILELGPDDPSDVLTINAAILRKLPVWTSLFALLHQCSHYVHENVDPRYGLVPDKELEREADRDAIRWIRENDDKIMHLLQDPCDGLSDGARDRCALKEISASISQGELHDHDYEPDTVRAAFIQSCFLTSTDDCTTPS